MKRLLAVMVIAAFGFAAFAEKQSNSARIGLAGGLNSASLLLLESPYAFRDMSIGAQVDITSLISIRPLLCLYSNTEKTTDLLDGYPEYVSQKTFAIGGQIDVPLRFLRLGDASVYAGPSIMYINVSTKDYSQISATTTYLYHESTAGIFGLGAIVGGQYNFSKSFSLYLDFLVSYITSTDENKNYSILGDMTTNKKEKNDEIAFRGVTIGAVFYLK